MKLFKQAPAPERRKITEPFDAVDLAEVFGAELEDVLGGCAACGNANPVAHKPAIWTQPQR